MTPLPVESEMVHINGAGQGSRRHPEPTCLAATGATVALLGAVSARLTASRRGGVLSASEGATEGASVRVVSLLCPPELSAAELSDVLMERGALYVSVSDGDAGTAAEEPIFASHLPGSDKPASKVDAWLQSSDESHGLWRRCSLDVGFALS